MSPALPRLRPHPLGPAPRMHALRPVELDFLEEAPVRVTSHRAVRAPVEVAAAFLPDARAWVEGAGLDEVTWTSPHPRGVGATRTVQIGPLVVDETFLAWTPHRLAFRVDHATTGLLAAFAEDWRVVPGAPGHCIVRWTVALELRGAARALQPAMPAVFRLAGLGVLHQLAGYLEARAAR